MSCSRMQRGAIANAALHLEIAKWGSHGALRTGAGMLVPPRACPQEDEPSCQ